MYFWNITQLKKDLSGGLLPDSESFKYLLAYVIVMGLPSFGNGTPITDRYLFSTFFPIGCFLSGWDC